MPTLPDGPVRPAPAYALRLADLADQLYRDLIDAWWSRRPDRLAAADDAVALVDSCALTLAGVARAWGLGGVSPTGVRLAGPDLFTDWSPFPARAAERFRDLADRVRAAAELRADADRVAERSAADRDDAPPPSRGRYADAFDLCEAVDEYLVRASTDPGESVADRRRADALERAAVALAHLSQWFTPADAPALGRAVRLAVSIVRDAERAVGRHPTARPDFHVYARVRRHGLAAPRQRAARLWERLVWADRPASAWWRDSLRAELATIDSGEAAAARQLPGPAPQPQLPGAAGGQPTADDAGPPAHAGDFSSAFWFGERYDFTPRQAAVVEQLWAEWERCQGFGLRESTLAERVDAGDAFRVATLFRDHPAFGRMIVPGESKGVFRLAAPIQHETRT